MEHRDEVGFQIRRLSKLVKRLVDRVAFSQGEERTTGMQGWIVGYLFENQGRDIYQRDIQEQFSVRRSTATGILQLMEKNGLITRSPVSHDARLKKLVLTEKAVALHTAVEERIRNTEKLLSEGLSEEEVAAFLSTAAKIEQNLTRARIPPAPHQETVPRRRDVPDPITEEESL